MKRIKRTFSLPIIVIIITAAVLRLVSLGYSDYQGDEIKAFLLPEYNQTTTEFLLDQRKGPVQFVITYAVKLLMHSYDNQLVTRLPFAIAGILSVYFFYKLVSFHFGKKIAFYSAFFLATNGFFVAFSRIVQYQSFVILFSILSLYFLSLAVKYDKFTVTGIYFGLIFWALSILSHYDGLFIAPFAFYLLLKWFKVSDLSKKRKLGHFITAGCTSLIMLLIFYIPFMLSISGATKDYWTGRVTGEVSNKISSSKYLFSVYQPIYVVHIYTILSLLGAAFICIYFISKNKKVNNLINKRWKFLITFTEKVINKSEFQSGAVAALILWLVFPLLFWESIVYISGTHIYTYILPGFIIVALGIMLIEGILRILIKPSVARYVFEFGTLIVFIFIFLQSYAVFVDHNQEYPWEEETFLIWTFPKPTPVFHLSMFGFPYFRNWEGIRDFINTRPEIDAYSTNERTTISRYYVPLEKDTDEAGFFIYIKNPQSFTNNVIYDKAEYWMSKNLPVHTFSRKGVELVGVYIMPVGTLDEIKSEGF